MTKIKVFHHLKRFITIVLVAGLSQVSAQSSNLGNTNNALQSTYENLIKIVDVLGRKTKYEKNRPQFYIYDDGSVEKKIIIE